MTHHTEVLATPLPADPLALAHRWLQESLQQRLQPNPNAMVIATVGPDGQPSARVVLCKEIVPKPGYLVFYTNYRSRKGRQLESNPRAAAVIHWDHLHRQIRVEGPIVKSPAGESDAYFRSRAWQSRLGAWASAQSEPIAGREELESAVAAAAQRFGTPSPDTPGTSDTLGAPLAPGAAAPDRRGLAGDSQEAAARDYVIPRPPHWGGYRLWVESIELWVEGDARIHDRARWTRSLVKANGGEFDVGPWTHTRLQP